MKRLYSVFIVLAALCISMTANAYTKQLLNETYSTAQTADQTGWKCVWDQAYISMAVGDFGKYVSFRPGNSSGDRAAYYQWDNAILNGVSQYTMTFRFMVNNFGNDTDIASHFTEFAVLPGSEDPYNETHIFKKEADAEGQVTGYVKEKNHLFALTQAELKSEAGDYPFLLNGKKLTEMGGSAEYARLNPQKVYRVTLIVNKSTGAVQYEIWDEAGNQPVAEGQYTVNAADADIASLYVMSGRSNGDIQFFNFQISTEVDAPYANKPNIYLSKVNGTKRDVTVEVLQTENQWEQLHFISPDGGGATEDPEDPEEAGIYVIENIAQSGELEAWTTCDGAESEHVKFFVDCSEITLKGITADVVSVVPGYKKQYKISVNREENLLSPTPFLHVKFSPEGAGTAIDTDIALGDIVECDSKGTMEITASYSGYTTGKKVVKNDVEYILEKNFDFMGMSEAEVAAATGMEANGVYTGDVNRNNFFNYLRIWPDYVLSDGTTMNYNEVFYNETDATYSSPMYTLKNEDVNYDKAFAPLQLWRKTEPYKMTIANEKLRGKQADVETNLVVHLGLWAPYDCYYDGEQYTYGYTEPITIKNGYAAQFFVVYTIPGYGRKATSADYAVATPNVTVLKGNEGFQLYRYDTVITKIEIFSPKDGDSAVNTITADKAADSNAPIYNLKGIRMDKSNLQKGLYIQNGKKFVVK